MGQVQLLPCSRGQWASGREAGEEGKAEIKQSLHFLCNGKAESQPCDSDRAVAVHGGSLERRGLRVKLDVTVVDYSSIVVRGGEDGFDK